MRWLLRCIAGLVALAVGLGSAWAQDDDEEELPFRPGLVATLSQGSTQAARIDPTVALAWQQTPPDARFARGAIRATWTGRLLTQGADRYRLYAYGVGTLEVKLAGKTILQGTRDDLGWWSSEVLDLEHDYHPLAVTYAGDDPEKRLRLYWSSESFALEPLPASRLFHEPQQAPAEAGAFEQGRELAAALRCAACHRLPGEKALAAPALDNLKNHLEPSWLAQWLSQPADTAERATYRHPYRGKLSEQETVDLAALLLDGAAEPPPAEKLTGDAARGERLFHTLGCLVCHQVKELGTTSPFSGGDLTHIADKRPKSFFETWLNEPARLNRDHRMPVFDLSRDERHDLAAYLATLASGKRDAEQAKEPAAGSAERGKLVAEKYRCASCHRMPRAMPRPDLVALPRDKHDALCALLEQFGGSVASDDQRRALQAYLAGVASVEADRPVAVDGERLLHERSCLACHARDASAGLAPQLVALGEAQSELSQLLPALTPPSLDAVGDKLHDTVLLAMIKRMEQPHRDYLQVRMPRFKLSEEELEAMLAHLVTRDRLPPQPPDERVRPPADLPKQEALEKAGERLVIAGEGLGCTSCHAIGNVQPTKAPINARGPNLSNIGYRLREPFFYRWCKNPARIIPGQEMPSVSVPVKGVLEDNLDHQLAAVWTILNKPGFEPRDAGPLRIVSRSGRPERGERAIVGTDVLKIDGQTYIKPLVVGLPNRHNVLLDLSEGRLARWWTGDAMEQRTKGKTWYWQADGADLLQSGLDSPDVLLVADGTEIRPERVGQFVTSFERIESDAAGVRVTHRLQFARMGVAPLVVRVQQAIEVPEEALWRRGFVRSLSVDGAPPETEFVLRAVSSQRMRDARRSDDGRALSFSKEGIELRIVSEGSATFAGDGTIRWKSGTDKQPAPPLKIAYLASAEEPPAAVAVDPPRRVASAASLEVVPGLKAERLPLDMTMMPIAIAWPREQQEGRFTTLVASLEGRVWRVDESPGAAQAVATPISEELAAPYGIAGAPDGRIDVLTKYGLVRLGNGMEMLAEGWGHTDDYHDWAVGLIASGEDRYLIALPCQQDQRSPAAAKHRGQVLEIDLSQRAGSEPRASLRPLTAGHRFPMGIARNRRGEVFVTDNQGNYNPFNELNHVRPGKHFGFINALDKDKERPPLTPPAINIPHPWTRSVNGICFLETPEGALRERGPLWGAWEGHLVGCEYDTRRLIRMSLQPVGETFQGACYPLSADAPRGETFLGPIACAVSPRGELYVGSIRDSGWGGGANIGELVRIAPPGNRALPPGIAEVRAGKRGFTLTFTQPVDERRAADPQSYSIQSFTRTSTPAYGGPDQERRAEKVRRVEVADDRRSVTLELPEWRTGFVYELHVKNLAREGETFFPAEAYYTLNAIPE